jgi:hypothetical protein
MRKSPNTNSFSMCVYTITLAFLANVIMVFSGCAHSTMERQVHFQNSPTLVKGSGRIGTYSIEKVSFEPKSSTGIGKDIWPKETLREVERVLMRDLAAQPWLGAVREGDAEWRLQMSCEYKAILDTSSAWLFAVPAAGIGLMGVGGAFVAKDSMETGTSLLISGAVVGLVGALIAFKPLLEPPTVTGQEMICQTLLRDRFNREVFSGKFSSSTDQQQTFEVFFVKAEEELFGAFRDELEKKKLTAQTVALDRGMGAVAVMDLDAGSLLNDGQRSMIAKLIASELQGLGVSRVLGVDDVKAVLGYEKQRQLLGCTDDTCVAQYGGALGVDRIVAGSVGQIGSTYIIELRLINVTKFGVDARTSRRASSVENLLDLIPPMARELILQR